MYRTERERERKVVKESAEGIKKGSRERRRICKKMEAKTDDIND